MRRQGHLVETGCGIGCPRTRMNTCTCAVPVTARIYCPLSGRRYPEGRGSALFTKYSYGGMRKILPFGSQDFPERY